MRTSRPDLRFFLRTALVGVLGALLAIPGAHAFPQVSSERGESGLVTEETLLGTTYCLLPDNELRYCSSLRQLVDHPFEEGNRLIDWAQRAGHTFDELIEAILDAISSAMEDVEALLDAISSALEDVLDEADSALGHRDELVDSLQERIERLYATDWTACETYSPEGRCVLEAVVRGLILAEQGDLVPTLDRLARPALNDAQDHVDETQETVDETQERVDETQERVDETVDETQETVDGVYDRLTDVADTAEQATCVVGLDEDCLVPGPGSLI